jgi:tetratricopeptide (TPR) repeat protein
MRPSPSLYNQGSLSDDDFVANFVARAEVLDALLRRLRATSSEDGTSHHILVGARGMGKTSLLRRLAIAINRNEDLAKRYVPLTFREEQYNVLTLCTFWKNCGESLAEWAEAVGDDALANKIDLALPTSAWASDEGAASQFAETMAELGKRAVLLIDNLDIVLAPLPPEKHWEFRRHLQAAHGPVVIGAATQLLAVSTDPKSAFYEFFQPHFLEALSMQETETCMRSLAAGRGQNGAHVLKVLTGQPERLKTLHTLTGGNPRVLALVYRLLEARESEEAMADLEILLDQVTPYYKSRIEEYQTPQQRAVIDAIALHWDPITTSSLAETTLIPSTTLSPLLIKLRKDGFIESTGTSGSYAGHQLVERFLNIWYLMRHGTRRARQKMRWLVAFLSSFYSPSDLKEIASRAKLERGPDCWQPEYAYAFEEALARNSLLGFAGPSVSATASFPDGLNEPQRLVERSEAGRDEAGTLGMQKLVNEALDAWTAGRFPSLHDALDDLSPNFGGRIGSVELAEFAMALVNKGNRLGQTGDHAAAIAVYDEVLARFGDAEAPALRERVATALVNKGITLGQTGDSVAEIAVYDEVLARFGDAEAPALREGVAMALVNKGNRLGQTGDSVAAIAVYDEVLARFGAAEAPALREQVTIVQVLLANLYIDTISNTLRAEDLLLQATARKSQFAKENLAWLYLLAGRVSDALPLWGALKEIPEQGLALLEAALEFDQDNFGSATTKLAAALGGELETGGWDFHDDLNRLLRLAEQTGYGERLVTWFEEAGYADRIAPVYVAFKAYVRGERILLDSSPEVQQPAKVIFDRLTALRRHQQEASQGGNDKPKRGRGRPRKI